VRTDQGRVVIGGITRFIGCLAVIVVLFHDGVVMGLGKVAVQEDAQVAAHAGAQNWNQTMNLQDSYNAAALAVESKGTEIDAPSYKVVAADGTVTLTANRDTSTFVAGHIHWFDSLTHPTSTASFSIPPQ
jgi:hypothetical protein